jgi:alkanesulfonate monooxygenase SsuD/methylene tetrahydromethanopterin reductase-like flavin-dependent oxidoreductase (luciferase family)
MNVGLCLPVFLRSPDLAFRVAAQAEAEGLDGVFCFDHLFPAGQPHRPSLSALPLLAALAQRTSGLRIGPLVSRVGVLPLAAQVGALATIEGISGGRLIAALGAGDSRSRPENDAYGFPTRSADERLAQVAEVTTALRSRSIEVWIGGNSPRVRRLADAEADGWNCWNVPPLELAAASLRPSCQKTWGGVPPADGDVAAHLRALSAAGAAWVVYGPAPDVDWPAFVGKVAGAAEAVH